MGVATAIMAIAAVASTVYSATRKPEKIKLPPVEPPKVPPKVETDAKKKIKKTTGQSDTIITGDTAPTLGRKSILG